MPLGQTNLPQGRIGLISHEILPPAAILDMSVTSVTSVTSITWTHVPNIKSLSFQSQRPFLQKTYRMSTPGNVPSVDQATFEAKMQEIVEARKFIVHRSVMTEEYHDELKAYLNKGLVPAE